MEPFTDPPLVGWLEDAAQPPWATSGGEPISGGWRPHRAGLSSPAAIRPGKEPLTMEESALLKNVSHLSLVERNPLLVEHAKQRAENVQNRIADRITTFAGSMLFVYLHIIWFGCWIGLGIERYPFGLLTMIVSLEAIFLSTFVMISQNRADAKRQVIADQQWQTVKDEDKQNIELLDLSNQILALTRAIHEFTSPHAAPASSVDGQ
jgi:uncharacterized membrane protein